MGTEALAFANLLLIIQGGVALRDQLQSRNANGNDRQEAFSRMFDVMQSNGQENGVEAAQNFFNAVNDNEIRIAPFPTQEKPFAITGVDDSRGSPVDQAFINRGHSPEIGPLETNEIEKSPRSLLMRGSSGPNDEKNEMGKNKEKVTVENRRFDSPELNQSFEDLVNNLPSSDVNPLVKMLIQKIKEKENENPGKTLSHDRRLVMKLQKKFQQNNERNAALSKNQTTQKTDVGGKPDVVENLKVQEKAKVEEKPKDEEKPTVQEKPKVQENLKEDKKSQPEKQNEVELCDCEGECEEDAHQDQAEQETPICDEEMMQGQHESDEDKAREESDKNKAETEKDGFDEEMMNSQAEQGKDKIDETQTVKDGNVVKTGEDQERQTDDKEQQKVLARIVVRIGSPENGNRRNGDSYPLRSSAILRNEIRPVGNPNLRHIFIRMSRTSSPIDNRKPSRSSSPTFNANRNEDDSSEYQDQTSLNKIKFEDHDQGLANLNGDILGQIVTRQLALVKALRNIALKRLADFDAIGGGQVNGEPSNSRSWSVNEDSDENMFGQIMPREMALLKEMKSMAQKQMAAFDTIRQNQESLFSHMPSFQPPNSPPTSSRVIIIRRENEPSSPLPPLPYPTGSRSNAAPIFQLQQTDSKSGSSNFPIPIFHLGQMDSESDSEPKVRIERVSEAEEKTSRNDFSPQQVSPSQDIPWFIKNIISNMELARQNGEDGSEPQMPFHNPAEDEKNPALIRALLAPFAL